MSKTSNTTQKERQREAKKALRAEKKARIEEFYRQREFLLIKIREDQMREAQLKPYDDYGQYNNPTPALAVSRIINGKTYREKIREFEMNIKA